MKQKSFCAVVVILLIGLLPYAGISMSPPLKEPAQKEPANESVTPASFEGELLSVPQEESGHSTSVEPIGLSKPVEQLKLELTDEEKVYISLFSPFDKTVCYKDKILVKGIFLKNGKVFVNKQEVKVNAGRFYQMVNVPQLGKLVLDMEFVDSDGKKILLQRRILRLKTYSDITVKDPLYLPVAKLGALKILPESTDKKLNPLKKVNRGELAKILVAVKNIPAEDNDVHFMDVPADYKYSKEIKTVVKNGLLSGYPDGTFRPKDLVTRAQLVVILTRISGLQIPEKVTESKFSDISPNYWAARYVSAALNEGLISESPRFYPDRLVDYQMIVQFMIKLKLIKDRIDDLNNFEVGYSVAKEEAVVKAEEPAKEVAKQTTEMKERNEGKVLESQQLENERAKLKAKALQQLRSGSEEIIEEKPAGDSGGEKIQEKFEEKIEEKVDEKTSEAKPMEAPGPALPAEKLKERFPSVSIFSPTDKMIVVKEKVLVKGKIAGKGKYILKVNGSEVKMAKGNRFADTVNVPLGKSKLIFTVNDKDFVFRIDRLKSYSDLPVKHWIYGTAIKLMALGYFAPEDTFRPADPLTNKEMAYAIENIAGIRNQPLAEEVNVQDVLPDNPYYNAIKNVVAHKSMITTVDGNFLPDKQITKADAIVFLSKFTEFKPETISKKSYDDVALDNPAIAEISYFKKIGLIDKGKTLEPDKPISKAQFAALIAKLSVVQNNLKKLETWDE